MEIQPKFNFDTTKFNLKQLHRKLEVNLRLMQERKWGTSYYYGFLNQALDAKLILVPMSYAFREALWGGVNNEEAFIYHTFGSDQCTPGELTINVRITKK